MVRVTVDLLSETLKQGDNIVLFLKCWKKGEKKPTL